MKEDRIPEEISSDIFAVSMSKSIPELLKDMSNEKLINSYYIMENSPEVTQVRVLQDILKSAQNSEFGKKYTVFSVTGAIGFTCGESVGFSLATNGRFLLRYNSR